MRPRIALGIAAVLILVLCEGMAHEAAAKLVRNAHPAPSNPAVEAGGLRVRRGSPPPVPYSLIGALASQNQVYWLYPRSAWLVPQRSWFSQSAFWPRRFFSPLPFGRPLLFEVPFSHPRQAFELPFSHLWAFERMPPPSLINWMPLP
jgi:hypothetical protein